MDFKFPNLCVVMKDNLYKLQTNNSKSSLIYMNTVYLEMLRVNVFRHWIKNGLDQLSLNGFNPIYLYRCDKDFVQKCFFCIGGLSFIIIYQFRGRERSGVCEGG